MEKDTSETIRKLTDTESIFKELTSLEREAFQQEFALYQQSLHGDAILNGLDRVMTVELMSRLAGEDSKKILTTYLPFWQEAHARATAVLITSNNRRILSLLSVQQMQSRPSVWHKLRRRVFPSR